MCAPELAALRERWLGAVTAALRGDPVVVGVALVGSLGAGTADDWSDVDLLVVVADEYLDEYSTRLPSGPGRLVFEIDARHNGPVGTRAVSAQYVVDGLPLWVDWHIHPVSRATWPADSTVVFDRQGISQASAALSEYRGEYEPATPKTLDEQDAMRLALVPIAGKQLARRSPETPRTIEFLGGTPETDWPDHLAALRELLNEFTNLDSLAAARAYLDLVEGTLG